MKNMTDGKEEVAILWARFGLMSGLIIYFGGHAINAMVKDFGFLFNM